jgi:nucleoside-diphosphate kinase
MPIHEGKSFYDKLIKYMTSGSIIALVLEKENAVASYRKLIGSN